MTPISEEEKTTTLEKQKHYSAPGQAFELSVYNNTYHLQEMKDETFLTRKFQQRLGEQSEE